MLKDLAKATVLTAVPLVVIICATFGARSVGESLRNVGIALLVAAAWVAISLVVVYGGVLHFVTRSHFNFLMCVLIGTCLAISWLVAGLAVWTSDHSTIPRIAATVALLWFAMTPAALITRGLRSDVSARTPGSSARPKLHRALEKRYYRLVPQERDENSAEESTPGRIARIGHWYRLVTGIASEQPSSPQTDSTADDPRVVN